MKWPSKHTEHITSRFIQLTWHIFLSRLPFRFSLALGIYIPPHRHVVCVAEVPDVHLFARLQHWFVHEIEETLPVIYPVAHKPTAYNGRSFQSGLNSKRSDSRKFVSQKINK
jgi:hypothetical protein